MASSDIGGVERLQLELRFFRLLLQFHCSRLLCWVAPNLRQLLQLCFVRCAAGIRLPRARVRWRVAPGVRHPVRNVWAFATVARAFQRLAKLVDLLIQLAGGCSASPRACSSCLQPAAASSRPAPARSAGGDATPARWPAAAAAHRLLLMHAPPLRNRAALPLRYCAACACCQLLFGMLLLRACHPAASAAPCSISCCSCSSSLAITTPYGSLSGRKRCSVPRGRCRNAPPAAHQVVLTTQCQQLRGVSGRTPAATAATNAAMIAASSLRTLSSKGCRPGCWTALVLVRRLAADKSRARLRRLPAAKAIRPAAAVPAAFRIIPLPRRFPSPARYAAPATAAAHPQAVLLWAAASDWLCAPLLQLLQRGLLRFVAHQLLLPPVAATGHSAAGASNSGNCCCALPGSVLQVRLLQLRLPAMPAAPVRCVFALRQRRTAPAAAVRDAVPVAAGFLRILAAGQRPFARLLAVASLLLQLLKRCCSERYSLSCAGNATVP